MIETLGTWKFEKGTLLIRQGDITTSTADAIVNAANSRLAGGGGVDGAIHHAAGPKLPAACHEIIERQGNLPAGQAVITPGFNLTAKYIIHTVGPVWRGGNNDEHALLASSYRKSVELAATNGVKTIEFPAVSCGVYGFPMKAASAIALETLAKTLGEGLVNSASMVIFSRNTVKTWLATAEELFGPSA